jgi:uncharacterized protein (TIGR00730 family)
LQPGPWREGGGIRRVRAFCGSNVGGRPEYAEAARRVGALIAGAGLDLVYGGGNVGLMGVLADAALGAGGEVVGVIPADLRDRELAHAGLHELIVVGTMHERKAKMADLSDAFAALPGGYGTLDELFEVLTWAQLGIHAKPIGLLDVGGFFGPLLAALDQMERERFLRPQHRALLHVADTPERLLELLLHAPPPPPLAKWLDATGR